MNAISETLKKIKAIFEEVAPVAPAPVTPEPAPVEFKEYSLMDGTKVKIDKVEAGGKVTINELPAPAAEYTLADGSVLVTDENGSITEVKPKEPAIEPVVEEAMTVAAFSTYKESKQAELNALKDELKTVKAQFLNLVDVVEKLTETPGADPIVKETFISQQKKSKDEMFAEMQKSIQSIKEKK